MPRGARAKPAQHRVYNRFGFEINAVVGIIEMAPTPPGSEDFNVTLPARQLPTYRDVYECNGHQFPNTRHYHLIRQFTIMYDLGPASYDHYLIFGCPNGVPRE